MPKFLTNLDLSKNELQNVILHPLATAPGSPTQGQMYYNTADKKAYLFNGSTWVLLTPVEVQNIGSLNDIADVSITLATTGDILRWNGTTWVNSSLAAAGIATADHTHSDATTLASGFMSGADKTKLDGIANGATANTGTVTSVAASAGTGISISGSPITTSGTITVTNTAPNATHTGDVTGSAALTIAADAVTNAKLANMPVNTIKGRITTGTGDPEDLTAAQVRTILNVADGAQANVATNLGYTTAATNGTVTSSTGTNATIPAATTSLAGLMTNADKTKLDGIATNANNYLHPTNTTNTGTALTGASVFSQIAFNADGHIISGTTRSLTAANIGAAATSHTHTLANITDAGTAAAKNVGTGSGNVPELDANGKLNTSVLPALAITETFVVASQAAMLALTAQTGDVAIRTDQNKSYILQIEGASTLANWQELLTPLDAVHSVNGKTGTVTLVPGDIGAAPSSHTHTKSQITDFAHTHTKSEITDFAHTHGNITNAGAIGSTSDLVVVTGASGVLTTQSRSGIDSRSTFPAAAHTLTSHSDVTITSPATGQLLRYNGSAWVNYTNKYVQTLSTSATSYTITHNLGTDDLIVTVREIAGDKAEVYCDIEYTNTTTLTLRFATAPTANQYRVIIIA